MSHTYKAVAWNRQKRIYDLVVLAGVVAYVGAFVASGAYLYPTATIESLLIRALGTCASLFLNVTLAVGPMARIWPGLRPLLYNRRHLGVITFLLALAHGSLATFQFMHLGTSTRWSASLQATSESTASRISHSNFSDWSRF